VKQSLEVESTNCCMPQTCRIPAEISSITDLLEVFHRNDFNIIDQEFELKFNSPLLLKAALGSGGFGLYFVDNAKAVLEVITAHARRAASFPGFVESLRHHYGEVPQWSLQQLVSPVRIAATERKTQVRAYIVMLNDMMYIYKNFEVRVPFWEGGDDDDVTECDVLKPKWSYEVENELVGDGDAIPYNERRKKSETERLLLEEVTELASSRSEVLRVLLACVSALQQPILRQYQASKHPESNVTSSLAIAGVDLVVTNGSSSSQFQAFIVEFNNNPAIADSNKRMSEKYRAHLCTFVSGLMILGLTRGGDDSDGLFQRIW